MIVTKAEFARGLRQQANGQWVYNPNAEGKGPNKSTVTRWGTAGRLKLNNGKPPKVKVEESLALINATQGGRSDVTNRHAQNRGYVANNATQNPTPQHNATTQADDDMHVTEQQVGADRAQYKAAKMDFDNKQLKLDEALNRGIRIFKEERDRELAKLGGHIKSGIERLIDNLAPQIAKNQNPKDTQQKLQQAAQQLLEQIQ